MFYYSNLTMGYSIGIFFLAAVLLFACGENQNQVVEDSLNQETTIDDEQLLLGEVDRKGFQKEAYKIWFDSTYQAYPAKDSTLNLLKSKWADVTIKVFMGTWCSDSQRDIPAFYKILDQTDFDFKSLEMIAVDRDKVLPKTKLEGYDIEYVPTIILYKDKTEIGRIIEYPEKSLEDDILGMLSR